MDDQLITCFKHSDYKLGSSGLVAECVSLAEREDMTAEELVTTFEAFAITR